MNNDVTLALWRNGELTLLTRPLTPQEFRHLVFVLGDATEDSHLIEFGHATIRAVVDAARIAPVEIAGDADQTAPQVKRWVGHLGVVDGGRAAARGDGPPADSAADAQPGAP